MLSKIRKIYHISYLRLTMASRFKTLIKRIGLLLGILIILFSSFLIFISLKDYDPPDFMPLAFNQTNVSQIEDDTTLSIITWNLGYAGLGKEMDFFYDGGKQVRASEKLSLKYFQNNLSFIEKMDSIDFWFFQEVDQHSKRSYFVDQIQKLTESLDKYNSATAINYSVSWVPVPILNPLGKVEAGLMSFSKYTPIEASRYAYPNIASWPDNLFLLDRCFILTRFLLPNNKHLVLLNTHNSYYVTNDSLRKIELDIIREKMREEFNEGNYVIAGGDWNRLPAGFNKFFRGDLSNLQKSIPSFSEDFLPSEWQWAFDTHQFTNRELNLPYDELETKKSSIDYFIVSPNIELNENFVFPLDFENSDHNPVYLKFRLKDFNIRKTDLL